MGLPVATRLCVSSLEHGSHHQDGNRLAMMTGGSKW